MQAVPYPQRMVNISNPNPNASASTAGGNMIPQEQVSQGCSLSNAHTPYALRLKAGIKPLKDK